MIDTIVGSVRSVAAFVADVAQGRPAVFRSPQWHKVEKGCIARDGGRCQWCGGTEKLEGHHKTPFHVYPAGELDEGNVITLCRAPGTCCHLRQGHRSYKHPKGDWKDYNPDIDAEVSIQRFVWMHRK